MLNLIKADLYKSFHRMYLYVFMGVMAIFAVLFNVIFATQGAPREMAFGSTVMLLSYPLFFVIMFVDIVLGEENKEHTLKNTISFGTSRTKLFISKNISAILITAVVAVVTLVIFYLSGLLLLKPGAGYTSSFLSTLSTKVGISLLIYVAGIVFGTCLAAVIKRNGLFIFAYFGALIVFPLLFKLLKLANSGFQYAENVMLMNQTDILAQATSAQMVTVIWVAFAHIAVFGILGVIFFKRHEVN